MRYMGDVTLPTTGLSPLQLASVIDALPPDQQTALLDAVDETQGGNQRKLLRIGVGAAGGVVLGIVIAKLMLK